VHQVIAIQIRQDPLRPFGRTCVFSLLTMAWMPSSVAAVSAPCEEKNSFHYVIIVSDHSVTSVDRFSNLPQADFGSLRHDCDILTRIGAPFCVFTTVSEYLRLSNQAYRAHVDLLRTFSIKLPPAFALLFVVAVRSAQTQPVGINLSGSTRT